MKINSVNMQYGMPNVQSKQSQQKTSFGFRISMLGETKTMPMVTPQFETDVRNAIYKYPLRYKEFLQDHGYKIIITPNLSDILLKNISGDNSPKGNSSKAVLSHIMDSPDSNEKYILLCDVKPFSRVFAKNITNYTLSSAIVNCLELHKNVDVQNHVQNDMQNLFKNRIYHNLSDKERDFFDKQILNSSLPEILSDLIAWNVGMGKYGSGLYGMNNPQFMKKIFPSTSRYLSENV